MQQAIFKALVLCADLHVLIRICIESTSFTGTSNNDQHIGMSQTTHDYPVLPNPEISGVWRKIKGTIQGVLTVIDSSFVQILHIFAETIGGLCQLCLPGELPLEQPVGSRNGLSRCLRSRQLSNLQTPKTRSLSESIGRMKGSPEFVRQRRAIEGH